MLVINLMRLGDLVQTSPVLRRLRAVYPEGRVTVAVMDLFQETAKLLPGVDRLVTFPSASLAALLDQEEGWPAAAQRLAEWLAQSFSRPPDLVINLTPNRLGGILAYATGAQEIRGMAVNQSWELGTRPDWASYALIVSRARQANPFNLVDLFLREGGLRPDGQGLEVAVPPEAEREAKNFLTGLNLPAETALIGLLPGASQPERRWPPENFTQAALMLLENRLCHFFFFGSGGEVPLGEAIAQRLPTAATTLLMGRTSVAVLAAYLKQLDLLITNDTGPMHLAAAVGTPTLALFLASARVQDTGPVGNGHVILEPRLDCHPCLTPCPRPHCHQAISPEVVSWWADKLLTKGTLAPIDDASLWHTARVYLSTTDPQGYYAYLPLVRRPLSRRNFWLWLHRTVWGQVLDGPTLPLSTLREWLEKLLRRFYLPALEDLGLVTGQTCLSELCQIASEGEELTQEILRLAGNGRNFSVRLWQKIEALRVVDQGLRRVGVAFPELAALVEFFFQAQRGKHSTEVIPLARELQEAYARLKQLGELTLVSLAELQVTMRLKEGGKDFPEMAQPMQNTLAHSEVLQPKSEGVPCR
jgi:ADP-heptose:LPS heptosyltransferase